MKILMSKEISLGACNDCSKEVGDSHKENNQYKEPGTPREIRAGLSRRVKR